LGRRFFTPPLSGGWQVIHAATACAGALLSSFFVSMALIVRAVMRANGKRISPIKVSVGKADLVHRRGPWRSAEAVEFATLEWFDWFNHRRLLELIGNIPPAEAEK